MMQAVTVLQLSYRQSRAMVLAGGAAILCVAPAEPAVAQPERGVEDGGDRRAAAAPSEPIVVTARKTEEDLGEVAAPLSVRSGDELREAGVRTPDELAQRFTGLTVLPNPTGNLFFVRGVGGFALTANTDPAVGWNYDGVFVARPVGTFGQLFDLERVELLKGPQGALHGRNATGGAVFVVPRRPVLGRTEGYAQVSYASLEAASAEGAVNFALGDGQALRLSGTLSRQDNLLEGYASGPTQQSARLQWAGEPGAQVSLRLAADYTHLGGVGLGTTYGGKYEFVPSAGRYRFVPSGLTVDQGIYTPAAQQFRQTIRLAALGRPVGPLSSVPFQDHDFFGLTGVLEARLGLTELTIQPSFRRSSLDAIAAGAPFGYRHLEEHRQSGIEARLAGAAGPLQWLAGGTVSRERVDVGNRLGFDFQAVFQDETYRTGSRSAFGRATVTLAPGLRVEGSARVIRDRRDQRVAAETVTLSCPLVVAGAPACPNAPVLGLYDTIDDIPFPVPLLGVPAQPVVVAGVATGARIARSVSAAELQSTDTSVSWRAGVEADLAPELLAYANVASANRPGGINNAVGFETYRPERLIAYTLGARWSPGQGWLSAAAELFWWDYRDQHVTSLQPDLGTPPVSRQITRNIGSSRIRGADFEVTARPDGRTDLRLAVQYLDARYRSFSFPQASPGAPPLTGCVTTPLGGTLYTVDCGGQRPFASPEWTATLRAERRFALPAGELALRAHSRFVTRQGIGTAFLPEQAIPAHWTSDAELAFAAPGKRFELAAFVRNVGNERVRNWGIFHPVTNALVTSTSAPRTFGARAFARF